MLKEADYLLKTGTLGPTLDQNSFNEDEQVVLQYFFTNLDRNIYAATDKMPSTLWALLMGGYSRSTLSVRQRFLSIFSEMQEEATAGKISPSEVVTITDFAAKIRSGQELNLSFFLSKAEQFMRKWAVQYGHDSLKDSDVVRFAIENVSQWATNPIEEARLGAYQEKSTRYVEFTRDSTIIPPELKDFETEVRAWNNLLLQTYEEAKSLVNRFIAARLNQSDFTSEAVFQRTVNAKTFDVIRYLLPTTMLTSLGTVWPTREAERHISQLLSDPRIELRAIGQALLTEGKKITPGLLSHVAENTYHLARRERIYPLLSAIQTKFSYSVPSPKSGRSETAVKLISITPQIEEKIAAAILFEHDHYGRSYQEYLERCLADRELVKTVFETFFSTRGQFDPFPFSAEVGNLIFEVTMDFGAYRDLQRHRRNLFLRAPLSPLLGIEYPEYIETEPELIELKQKFDHCAQKTVELYQLVKTKNLAAAEYITMFAHKQKVLWQFDPRQLVYIIELRTRPAGHHSYRNICQRMFKIIEAHLPLLSKYIRVDFSTGEEGRKQQEEKIVAKLKALGANLERVS